MPTVQDSIDLLHPSNGVTGVPLNNTIQVIFDTEIDEWSIENGGLIVEGLDTDLVIHPGYAPTTLIQGEEQEILQSPGLRSIVPGKFTFQRISLLDDSVVNISDTTGDGTLYRTKVIFTPDTKLSPNHKYNIFLIGDDDITDDNDSGIRTRTVFDPVADISNTGTGTVTFSGTYTGSLSQDALNIRITKAGVIGVAEYEVWRTSAPLDVEGPFLTSIGANPCLDGTTIQFTSGDFDLNDEFTVVVKRPVYLEGIVYSEFTTGGGSITVPPSGSSTSVTGSLVPIAITTFEVLSTSPADHDSNLPLNEANRIIITFSKELDSLEITSDMIEVLAEPIIDHPLLETSIKKGQLNYSFTVSGTKLIIDL